MNRRCIVVLTSLPDAETAQALAKHLLELRLAACVNVLGPCTSMYHWQGKIETAGEIPMLIKATADNFPAIEAAIAARHPYQVPEIVALPIEAGSSAYLSWLTAESRSAEHE